MDKITNQSLKIAQWMPADSSFIISVTCRAIEQSHAVDESVTVSIFNIVLQIRS